MADTASCSYKTSPAIAADGPLRWRCAQAQEAKLRPSMTVVVVASVVSYL